MIEVEIAFDNITDNLKFRVPREWYFSGEHNVEDNAEGPDVNLRVVVLEENFGGDVVRLNESESVSEMNVCLTRVEFDLR